MAVTVYEGPLITPNQKTFAKAFLAAYAFKRSDLTKAYLAACVAAMYGIRAARKANADLNEYIDQEEMVS